MKRYLLLSAVLVLFLLPLAAQSDDDLFFNDDALFGDVTTASDDIFGESSFSDISFGDDDAVFADWSAGSADDALFGDDGIDFLDDSLTSTTAGSGGFSTGDAGVVFQAGSVRIGGRFTSSIDAGFLVYDEDDDSSFKDRIFNTTISPAIAADISVDARPTDALRMYTKFNLAYPFITTSSTDPITHATSISDFLKIKEMFTDFEWGDRVFFRFGLHTVSWGTGYFFSPCSDMINSGRIDPENADEQVDGSLNLRTQIIFLGSQNCLWLYVIPETGSGAQARDTALAAKMDIIVSAFELGTGAFWKYDHAPKAMLTASGSIFDGKVSVFGEGVFQYGADSEWASDTSFDDKTALFKATAGFSYYWKDPKIMLMGQYYYDGNNKDAMFSMTVPMLGAITIPNQMYGHNVALMASFGDLPGLKDCSLALFGMLNVGKDDLNTQTETVINMYGSSMGISTKDLASARATATLSWAPSANLSFGAGISATWPDFDTKPVLKATLSATLGGGKF